MDNPDNPMARPLSRAVRVRFPAPAPHNLNRVTGG